MRSAVDDVHHRHGQHVGVGATYVAVERYLQVVGGCVGHGQRHAKDGVGAKVRLGLGAVKLQHLVVDGALLKHRHAHKGGGYHLVDVFDCLEHALAAIALLVAVAQFERLVLACRGSRRYRCAAGEARLERHFYLNRWISS